MYNIDLQENETIIYNNDETKIKANDKILDISLVITNNRLIILQDSNKLGNMNNVLRTTKGLGFIPNREIIFQINRNEIKDIIYNEYAKIIFNNNTFIEVKDENIKHILENANK